MKRIIGFIVLLFTAILTGYISFGNSHTVEFVFLGTWNLPLVLLLALALALGAVMGILASMVAVMKTRAELRRARREVKVKEQEIENLRAIPFKEQN